MSKKMLLVAMIVAIMVSFTVGIALPPPPDDGYSNSPLSDGPQYPPYPPGYPENSPYPPYPPDQQGSYPPGQDQDNHNMDYQGSSGGHPSSGPSLSGQPQYAPSASTGKVASNLGEGQTVSEKQVMMVGGEPSGTKSTSGGQQKLMAYYVGGLQQWALYNGYWTNGPSAVNYYGRMNVLVDNDQGQYIWSYEKYPYGQEYWKSWGYWGPGYHNTWFLGDATGWHAIAVWGSQSGWSNVLWIYVW